MATAPALRSDGGIATISMMLHLPPQQTLEAARHQHRAGQLAMAERLYRQAIAAEPALTPAHLHLGHLLRQTRRTEEACAAYQEALRLDPACAEACSNLGIVLRTAGRLAEAAAACRQAIALRPDYLEAHGNLGNVLRDLGAGPEAAACYHKVLALDGSNPEAYCNLANIARDQGDAAQAIALSRKALTLQPDLAEAHLNLGLALLADGQFADGWEHYEWRWENAILTRRSFAAPRWDGADLAGRTVLLHAEQGLGDTLQFIRYAPLVAARQGRVVVECQKDLVRLVQQSLGAVPVLARGNPLPHFDVHCPLLSLPRLFGTTLASIPTTVPYLLADPQSASAWAARLAPPPQLRVGLVWAGRPQYQNDRHRSLTLAALAPLARVPGVVFYSLQRGAAAAQTKAPPPGMVLHDWTADLHDFADNAALLANMDLLISVDTSMAHLAGAMGKPCWILVPSNPHWTWMRDRADSPWYPTARLFRQALHGAWQSVIEQVAAALHNREHPPRRAAPRDPEPRPPASAVFGPIPTGQSAAAAEANQRGNALAQQGSLAQAIPLFQQAIALQPQFPEAWNNLGNALWDTNRRDEASAAYRQAITLRPDYARAWFHLGCVLKELRQRDEAVAALRQAVALQPHNPQAWSNLGEALQEMGQSAAAIAAYRKAVAQQPDMVATLNNLGNALCDQGQLEAAETVYRQALALRPDLLEPRSNLGSVLRKRGQLDEALIVFRAAVALAPQSPEAHNNLGVILRDLGQLDESIAACRQALALQPHYAEACTNLGNALKDQGQFAQATAAYRQAIALQPANPAAYSSLGQALREQGQPAAASAACRQAIALQPAYPEAYNNLGHALKDQGQVVAASAAYQQAVALNPGMPEFRVNLGLARLLLGDFAQGWVDYEWRWQIKNSGVTARDFSQPLWDGTAVEGRTVLLHAEQGLGDTLQFIRYVPLAARRARVVVECQKDLVRLVEHSLGTIPVIARGDPLPHFDVHCPLMSLPRLFGTTLASIPATVPYIVPDPQSVSTWAQRWGTTSDFKVGLVWAGGPQNKDDRRRSCALATLSALGKVPGVALYSLQRGPAAAQSQNPPPGMILHDWTADLHDFADNAALLANMDLVISVDTSIAHLAGAMGKPVWVLLSFAADWRWLLQRTDSPWYPTARLFRQARSGDWQAVIAQVAEALANWPANETAR